MKFAPRRGPKSLVQRLTTFWLEQPGASLSTREALEIFGGTPHAFREAVHRLRRLGTPVRCERVYRLRHRPAEDRAEGTPS